MAKNISILEGRKARNFSGTKKLRTDDRQLWIPEDEAGAYCDFETLEVTENGTYYASGCDGYDRIEVNVTGGGKDFTEKTIFRNGQYTPADDNSDGYSVVNVNVPQGGGGGLEYTLKWTKINDQHPGGYGQASDNNGIYRFHHDGSTYKFTEASGWQSMGSLGYINVESGTIATYNGKPVFILGGWYFEYNNGAWVKMNDLPQGFSVSTGSAIEYGGLLHAFGSNGKHYAYNGSTWSQVSDLPANSTRIPAFVLKDELHIVCNGNKDYIWNGSGWTDTGITLTSVNTYVGILTFKDGSQKAAWNVGYSSGGRTRTYNGTFDRPDKRVPTGANDNPSMSNIGNILYAIASNGVYKAEVIYYEGN